MAAPFRLSDSQLAALMSAATPLDPDKRALLLERVGAQLRLTGSCTLTDDDVRRALDRSLPGLQHSPAA